MKDITEYTGFSRQTIHKLMNQGKFPQPIRIGGNTNVWLEEELNNWLEAKIDASRQPLVDQGNSTSLAS